MSTEEQIYNLYQKTNSYKQQVPYDFIVEEEKLRIEKLPVNSNLENNIDKLQHFQLAYINRTNTTLPICYMEALLPALDVENVLYTDDYKEFYDNEKGSDIYAKIHKQVDDILNICEPTRYTPEKLALICDLYNTCNKKISLTKIYSKFHPDFSDEEYLSVVNKINTIFNTNKDEFGIPMEKINKALEVFDVFFYADSSYQEKIYCARTKLNGLKRSYEENIRNQLDALPDYNGNKQFIKSK